MIAKKVRVLVVEDSLTVRKRLVAALEADPELDLVGEAADGKTAFEMCQALRPDVITLDMVLPVMSGLATAEAIMAFCPTPILVVSASQNRGEAHHTLDALAAGAVDVLEKPDLGDDDLLWDRRLRGAVKLVSRIRVVTHPRARLQPRVPSPPLPPRPTATQPYSLLAIGASTGGPAALSKILSTLPRTFPLPVVVVVHLDVAFDEQFASWLDGISNLRVRRAAPGLPPPPGMVTMAPAGRHLKLVGGRLRFDDGPERHSCCPSIDTLFESIAADAGDRAIGCLLTGMGADGAVGLLAMRRAGGMTFAQDEASSVVYGMPRAAAALSAAVRVLPLSGFAPALCELAGTPRGNRPAVQGLAR